MSATVIGHHGGRSRAGKARQMTARLRALRRWARDRSFDIALAHGSHELTMTAHRLGIPSATTFDYEWAWLQHQLGCRAATRVVVPDSIPIDRLARYGAVPPKLVQYSGLKEEYYLADFDADPSVLASLGIDKERVLVVLRPAARRLSLPPPFESALPADPASSRVARVGSCRGAAAHE